MKTVVIKPNQMMKKLNPHNKWEALGMKSWQTDYGLIQAFNKSREGIGDYFVGEKSHKSLWDLFLNCSEQEVITAYYGYPKPVFLNMFLVFCFNYVAADYYWKEAKANDGKDQMDWFPFESLWKEYEEKIISKLEEKPVVEKKYTIKENGFDPSTGKYSIPHCEVMATGYVEAAKYLNKFLHDGSHADRITILSKDWKRNEDVELLLHNSNRHQ